MAGAYCASLTSLTNAAAPKLLKPVFKSSSATPLPPRKLTRRKNYLRPKILKTLSKPLSVDPVRPIISPPQYDTLFEPLPQSDPVFEPPPDEIGGIVPAVNEVGEIQVSETERVAEEYNGGFGNFSAKSVLKIGLGLVGVFVLQTICTVWVLGNANSDEKNKNSSGIVKGTDGIKKGTILVNRNVVYLDKIELEDKINEIRAMAREARKTEKKELKNGAKEDGIVDDNVNSKSRIGVEKEISTRLVKLDKKLNSRKGKLPGSYKNLLNEFEDDEDEKEEDKTLMFKKKFKFRSPSVSSTSNIKGFSGSEDHSVNKKKKSGLISPNGGSRGSVSGTVEVGKNGSEALCTDLNSSPKDIDNLEKKQKEMGVRDTNTRNGNLKRRVLGNKPSANKVEDDQSDFKSDLWWLNLPYVLGILMHRGLDNEGAGGLFTLRDNPEMQNPSQISYTVAFEDRGDANNFCYLLESYFEDLGDFSAEIVPLSVNELHDAVKSSPKKVLVVKKGQLKLYAGQPFADVEMALCSLVEKNYRAPTTNIM